MSRVRVEYDKITGGVKLDPTLNYITVSRDSSGQFEIDSTKDHIVTGYVGADGSQYSAPLAVFIPQGAIDTSDINILSLAPQSSANLSNGYLSVYNGNYGKAPMFVSLITLD